MNTLQIDKIVIPPHTVKLCPNHTDGDNWKMTVSRDYQTGVEYWTCECPMCNYQEIIKN